MAKTSIRMRALKREKLIKKYAIKRKELKKLIKSSSDVRVIMDSQEKLAKLPVNSNPVRHCTRCACCGRSHAVYRKVGLCRLCFREAVLFGNVPGVRMSSW